MTSYVYIYLDPRKPGSYIYGSYSFEYEPIYVGKGTNERRMLQHLEEAFLNRDSNKLKANKILKIKRETNQDPIVIKFKENLTEDESFALERNLIKTIGRIDLESGPLTNLTDGGEGQSGVIVSEKTRKFRSENIRGDKHPMFGKKHSEETRLKIKFKRQFQITSEETKKKMSDSKIGDKHPNFGKPMSNKQKANISKSKIGTKASEKTRNLLSSMRKGSGNSNAKFKYLIFKEDGTFIKEELDLKEFCKTNNINYVLTTIHINQQKPYKGFLIKKELKNPINTLKEEVT